MSRSRKVKPAPKNGIAKCPTGIFGLDQIREGGLPKGRPTLICGAAGCGKTILGMEFLVRGATEFGEPGVFMAFEETGPELSENGPRPNPTRARPFFPPASRPRLQPDQESQ